MGYSLKEVKKNIQYNNSYFFLRAAKCVKEFWFNNNQFNRYSKKKILKIKNYRK